MYNIDFDKPSSANLSNLSKSSANADKINIRVPDLISNTESKFKDNAVFNNDDESDYELDTRKPFTNEKSVSFNFNNKEGPTSNYTSIQMKHEVR